MTTRTWYFSGGAPGDFAVTRIYTVAGEGLPIVTGLTVSQEPVKALDQRGFVLKGVVSNERYATRDEKSDLASVQQPIGRDSCRLGALIPIRKNSEWWNLSQDERRKIFEERSSHIAVGRRALPAVARRLHHCRDLETPQPFDFLTWFDFSPEDEAKFDDLLGALRSTEEWQYVEREVEVRVMRRQ